MANNNIPNNIIGRHRRGNSGKHWCFTYNNYPEDWESIMAPWLRENTSFIVGIEVAPTTGTPHLQGYVEFRVKTRPKEKFAGLFPNLAGVNSIHWASARGNRAQNITYCSKSQHFLTNMTVERELWIAEMFGWQAEVINLLKPIPDARTIFWFWEPLGNYGKTALVRYLVHKFSAVLCGGKAADAKFLIVKHRERHGVWPELVIFNLPRTMEKFVSYQAIEEIKDGCFASTKYECEVVLMNHPHVVVFANFGPDLENPMLSLDRFYIRNIREESI